MKKINWFITGGCGFLGSNLTSRLTQIPNQRIRILDNFSVGKPDDLPKTSFSVVFAEKFLNWHDDQIQIIEGDILNEDLVCNTMTDADIIVHLAANTGVHPSVLDPRSDMLSNVVGTLNCLEGARKNNVLRFIFASSGAPIGECTPPIHEELAPHPVSPYGASKLAGEGYCSAYCRSFNVQTVALRFGNVYGPFSQHKVSVVANFIKSCLSGNPLIIYGDGTQTRDFIYIDDLISAILKASTSDGIGGEIFQIATNMEHTVHEVAQKLLKELELTGKKVVLKYDHPRQGDVLRNFSDTTKAKLLLNWEPKISLNDGLTRTLNWFINHYKIT